MEFPVKLLFISWCCSVDAVVLCLFLGQSDRKTGWWFTSRTGPQKRADLVQTTNLITAPQSRTETSTHEWFLGGFISTRGAHLYIYTSIRLHFYIYIYTCTSTHLSLSHDSNILDLRSRCRVAFFLFTFSQFFDSWRVLSVVFYVAFHFLSWSFSLDAGESD